MAFALLTDIKLALGTSTTTQDAMFNSLLASVSARAEREIGAPAGGLGRQVGIVEVVDPPADGRARRETILLDVWPIESVANVIQFWEPSSAAEFAAEVANAEAMTPTEASLFQNVDWMMVGGGRLGELLRINQRWLVRPQCLEVIYTAGWIDPVTSDPPETAILPPADLQRGIVLEVVRQFQTQQQAGLSGQVSAGAGASFTPASGMHPALVEACARLRRYV